ncbi:MAG: Fic family protein [Mucilaginibacter sp.]|jgi:Fic family protein|uniref:Fic family protein n=1 Tax=Mucilaginibacter sp. TaxID=1882438 RepID=UPI003563CBD7
MNPDLEIEFSKAPILQEIDALKKQIDDMRPLPADVEGRVMQKLRLDWNYNSNAIEGNKLSYGETVAFLMEGITAKGKPLKDHLDIRGHNEAINFLLDLVKDSRPISEADIRALHKMILVEPYKVDAQTADGKSTTKTIKLGEYKQMSNHVKTATGETHYYATPDEVKVKMPELIEWYKEANSYENIHPIVVAALFHHKFVAIHPFDDGNGRLSRILMNLILMQKGFPPAVIMMDDRTNYYSLLSRADNNDNWPFVEYIAERLQNSLQLYLKAANGGDIDEDEDIDKDIALFKLGLLGNTNLKEKRSVVLINDILNNEIDPLINKLTLKAKQFEDLFFEKSHGLGFYFIGSEKTVPYEVLSEFTNLSSNAKRDQMVKILNSIGVVFSFNKFKNNINDFDILVWITIDFDEYSYRVSDFNDKLIVNKLYHEKLTSIDENNIVKAFINDIKILINRSITKKSLE